MHGRQEDLISPMTYFVVINASLHLIGDVSFPHLIASAKSAVLFHVKHSDLRVGRFIMPLLSIGFIHELL